MVSEDQSETTQEEQEATRPQRAETFSPEEARSYAAAKKAEIGALELPDPIKARVRDKAAEIDILRAEIAELINLAGELIDAPAGSVCYHYQAGMVMPSQTTEQASLQIASIYEQIGE